MFPAEAPAPIASSFIGVVGDDLKFNVTIGDMGEGELIAKRVK